MECPGVECSFEAEPVELPHLRCDPQVWRGQAGPAGIAWYLGATGRCKEHPAAPAGRSLNSCFCVGTTEPALSLIMMPCAVVRGAVCLQPRAPYDLCDPHLWSTMGVRMCNRVPRPVGRLVPRASFLGGVVPHA